MKSRQSKEQIAFDFARRANFSGSTRVPPKQRSVRVALISGVCLVWSLIVIARLYSLQVRDFEFWQDWALKQHFSEVQVASERGPIVDRDGNLLAVSVPAGSVYVRPKQIKDLSGVSVALSEILDIPPSVIQSKIGEKRPFTWIKRQLPRSVSDRVMALNLSGVGVVMESKRLYPLNEAGSTLIGKAGVDGDGLSGIELLFDQKLRGPTVSKRLSRDALGNFIDTSNLTEFVPPKGQQVELTIDAGIQVIMEEETQVGRNRANAKSAFAVMLDSETGEILGLSQAPASNFNLDGAKKKELGNLAIEAVFEPGSMMKPLIVASALESGLTRPDEIINCEGGRYPVYGKVIKDVHPYNLISVRDIIIRSSNIGMTKLGLRMGREGVYSALKAFGFGDKPKLGLPGESAGILRPENKWAMIDIATHSFGQGIAVTPIQMARAVAAVANGGRLPDLSVIKNGEAMSSKRILSEKVAGTVREMMYAVVEDEHGTGSNAIIKGVRVGGKTGTAQKARTDGRGYAAGKYMAGFVGFADGAAIGVARNLTLMVVVDEPNTTSIYGGTLAAPVFKRIMQRTMHYLATSAHLGGAGSFESGKETKSYDISL